MDRLNDKLAMPYYILLEYLLKGEKALIIFTTIRNRYLLEPDLRDEIFIGTVIFACYDQAILSLCNLLKSDKDSISLHYFCTLFENQFGDKNELNDFIQDYINKISNYSNQIEAIKKIRDKTIAHVDRCHINDQRKLIINPPITYDDLETIYGIVGTFIRRVGSQLGFINMESYSIISYQILKQRTELVFDMLYKSV